MGLFKKIKKDFPELIEIIVRFSSPIRIPKVWKDLLALERLPESAFKLHGDVSINDPVPYCDDKREVVIKQGDISVYAILCSGTVNYWIEWELWDGPDIIGDSEGEPEFDIPESTVVCSDDNKMKVELKIELT